MCRFGWLKPRINPEGSGSHVDEDVSIPLASARDPTRASMTPERRERMPPDQEVLDRNHHGSPDFGGGVGHHSDDAYCEGTHPREQSSIRKTTEYTPESHQRTKFREVALYTRWNR